MTLIKIHSPKGLIERQIHKKIMIEILSNYLKNENMSYDNNRNALHRIKHNVKHNDYVIMDGEDYDNYFSEFKKRLRDYKISQILN